MSSYFHLRHRPRLVSASSAAVGAASSWRWNDPAGLPVLTKGDAVHELLIGLHPTMEESSSVTGRSAGGWTST